MILRLSQFAEAQADTFRVELSFDNAPPVRTHFKFALSPQDQEDIRWYLEDYLQYPLDPAPTIAARIETRMRDVGIELFKHVFQSSDDARDLWSTLRPKLNDTRIEIITEIREATSIPWELLRDPRTDEPLALNARTFIRAPINPVRRRSSPSKREGEKIRILLVICRPKAAEDVPFRSVASRIVKSLSEEAHEIVQLDVLRPPTFEQLGKTLRQAKAKGEPYHVVHFDGHGVYDHTNKRGYVIFENPGIRSNFQYVDGGELGNLLFNNDVTTLVLNACQSAMAEAPTTPLSASESDEVGEQVRAFGSLAQEVMDKGVAGIVAMRYILYVETAKRFVADLYAALAQGQSLGEAVTFGRKQLATNPQREIAYKPINLQDWCVPIVYESSTIELFPRRTSASPPRITTEKEMTQRGTEIGLPPRLDIGFFGRDETLLALDRAFDTQSIVLLHAFAGSGKTTTAVEFARWYALTGGVQGPIFFSSFEHRKTLANALNETIGRAFNDALEQSGVHWLTLTDDQRRTVALQVMRQVPILWIWDNVEPIAGFPAGTKSAWNESEQKELREFLQAARETKAKFLLTSRRDEQKWLGYLPRRIVVPPMPMQERVQLARALAEKFGHRITDVEDWRPLLQFTQGNPLTITVLVGQALRGGLRTKLEIEKFVERLRKGEAAFADEASEGRSKSLGASLNYGFENAFTETERKQLALLHFFQGFVEAEILRVMGDTRSDWCLPVLRGITREAIIILLDRAVEIGLLTAHGNGHYSIHPALPWYFKSLFEQYCPIENQKLTNTCGFVQALGELGNYYAAQYEHGNRDVIDVLGAEEANLLHARQLARKNKWWGAIINTMQGLRPLYSQTGQRAEWTRLVHEIVPDFIDPVTDGPLSGREEEWDLVMEYRIRLEYEARHWEEVERLAKIHVDVHRQRAFSVLMIRPSLLNTVQVKIIRELAMSVEHLGHILRGQSKPECKKMYEEAISLYQHIDDHSAEAVAAFNLGHTYKDIPALRNLAQAKRWYRRSLTLHDERDRLERGKCHCQLGQVAYEQFNEALSANRSEAELKRHLNDSLQFCQQALDLLPPNAVDDLAVTHNSLGVIYKNAGELDNALLHYSEAIRCDELAGNLYAAAQDRFNVAIALAQAGRLKDAWEYALTALRNFESFGDRATEMIEMTKQLIGEIEGQMSEN